MSFTAVDRPARLRGRAARAARLGRAACRPARSSSSSTPAPTTAAPALARDAGAELIELPDNPGFGAANNAGLARARHPVTVLLNPDTELVDDALCMSSPRWRESTRMRCTRHACSSADGSPQRSAHPLPGHASARCCPRSCTRRCSPARCASAPSRTAPTSTRTVGWAIAACLAADTATLRRLGPFDPAVHLFAEDMELGLRARALGIPTVLHPGLRVRHAGGHAVLRGGEPFELLARRRREAIARHARRAARWRSTTPPRRSPSRPGSPAAGCSAATPTGSAPNYEPWWLPAALRELAVKARPTGAARFPV